MKESVELSFPYEIQYGKAALWLMGGLLVLLTGLSVIFWDSFGVLLIIWIVGGLLELYLVLSYRATRGKTCLALLEDRLFYYDIGVFSNRTVQVFYKDIQMFNLTAGSAYGGSAFLSVLIKNVEAYDDYDEYHKNYVIPVKTIHFKKLAYCKVNLSWLENQLNHKLGVFR